MFSSVMARRLRSPTEATSCASGPDALATPTVCKQADSIAWNPSMAGSSIRTHVTVLHAAGATGGGGGGGGGGAIASSQARWRRGNAQQEARGDFITS